MGRIWRSGAESWLRGSGVLTWQPSVPSPGDTVRAGKVRGTGQVLDKELLKRKKEVSFVPCAWLWESCGNEIHTVPAFRELTFWQAGRRY